MSMGLYVHVPYCTSLCPYCDFNSHVDPKASWDHLLAAYQAELNTRASLFDTHALRSIYFGGGTPSLAPASCIEGVIHSARDLFQFETNMEITLEANPGSVNAAKFEAFLKAGVNRISLGWQSTHDKFLRVLGRGHSAQDSHQAFVDARKAGFKNISIDLIFSVPGQTLDDLHRDLDAVQSLAPEHVSLYALTFHEGTPFYKKRAQGKMQQQPEEHEVEMMQIIETRLQEAGYTHYEVSNYAQPGKEAVHNSLYWCGANYLGVGPGAHSFLHHNHKQGWRFEGTLEPKEYMAAWQQTHTALPQQDDGTVTFIEALSESELFAERMMCGLRTRAGVSLKAMTTDNPEIAKRLQHGTEQAMAQGWAVQQNDQLRPTALGLMHADSLGALFF